MIDVEIDAEIREDVQIDIRHRYRDGLRDMRGLIYRHQYENKEIDGL